MSSLPLNFHLEHYEGPLDLLLDLIRKQQIDIYDIPIARITSQYLDYMERAAELDVELSAEFVYMAATLIHIKSRLLLPRDPQLEEIDPQDDPRKELVDKLLEHERFKSAAEMLQQKRVIEEAVWSNPQIEKFLADDDNPGLAVTLFDLVKTFQQVLDRTRNRPVFEVGKEEASVPQMIQYLGKLLKQKRKTPLSVTQLFEKQTSRRAMICLFLAILELVKRQAVLLTQCEAFADIGLEPGGGLEDVIGSGEQLDAIAKEYEGGTETMKSSSTNQETRKEKVDPADARDTTETFLPGQIPVEEADSPASDLARRTEQQPDPADAAKAVNSRDLLDTKPEDRKTGE